MKALDVVRTLRVVVDDPTEGARLSTVLRLAERALDGRPVSWPCDDCTGSGKMRAAAWVEQCETCLGTGERLSPEVWALVERFRREIRQITEERDHAIGELEEMQYEVDQRPIETISTGGRL